MFPHRFIAALAVVFTCGALCSPPILAHDANEPAHDPAAAGDERDATSMDEGGLDEEAWLSGAALAAGYGASLLGSLTLTGAASSVGAVVATFVYIQWMNRGTGVPTTYLPPWIFTGVGFVLTAIPVGLLALVVSPLLGALVAGAFEKALVDDDIGPTFGALWGLAPAMVAGGAFVSLSLMFLIPLPTAPWSLRGALMLRNTAAIVSGVAAASILPTSVAGLGLTWAVLHLGKRAPQAGDDE